MNLILPLRIVQAVCALIVLGLAGYCVDVLKYYPEAAFMVFTSVWTFVILAYLLLSPMYYPQFHNRWVVVGSEAITMIFWFAGFIALADSTKPSRFICFGAGCQVLSCAKAAAVFGAFSWIAWAVTLGLIVHALIQYRKGEAGGITDAGKDSEIGVVEDKTEGNEAVEVAAVAPNAGDDAGAGVGAPLQDLEVTGSLRGGQKVRLSNDNPGNQSPSSPETSSEPAEFSSTSQQAPAPAPTVGTGPSTQQHHPVRPSLERMPPYHAGMQGFLLPKLPKSVHHATEGLGLPMPMPEKYGGRS